MMKFVELRTCIMKNTAHEKLVRGLVAIYGIEIRGGGGGVVTSEVEDWFRLFSWSPLWSGLGTELLEWRGDR